MRALRAPLACSMALLGACAVGPDFKSPQAPDAERFSALLQAQQTTAAAVPGGEAQSFAEGRPLSPQWWTLFGSDKLNALVAEALRNSPSLASAQAALRNAQALYTAERGGLLPTADGNVSATRQKVDTASFANPVGGTVIYNLYHASVDVSYGLDLFGGTRRAIEAQSAQLDFQQFQLEGVYQTLIANVITSAVQEARLRALIKGRQMTLANLEGLLQISEKQFELGAIGQSEVLLARSNLATEQASLPQLERDLALAQHQLAAYLGQLPSARATTPFELTDLRLPQELPLSLPSELVRQRPDIRAAEAQLHRASAEVGIATANQFPQLRLTGSYGSQASTDAGLFDAAVWSIGAGLTQPLFRAGALNARRRAAIAAFEQADAEYRQAVLLGFKNVADALRTLEADARIVRAQLSAAESAEAAMQLINRQYELGVISYVDVLTAQRQTTLAKTGLVQALADRYQNTAALLLALGGGWWNRPEPMQPLAQPQP